MHRNRPPRLRSGHSGWSPPSGERNAYNLQAHRRNSEHPGRHSSSSRSRLGTRCRGHREYRILRNRRPSPFRSGVRRRSARRGKSRTRRLAPGNRYRGHIPATPRRPLAAGLRWHRHERPHSRKLGLHEGKPGRSPRRRAQHWSPACPCRRPRPRSPAEARSTPQPPPCRRQRPRRLPPALMGLALRAGHPSRRTRSRSTRQRRAR
jgi:hypothetical protein